MLSVILTCAQVCLVIVSRGVSRDWTRDLAWMRRACLAVSSPGERALAFSTMPFTIPGTASRSLGLTAIEKSTVSAIVLVKA